MKSKPEPAYFRRHLLHAGMTCSLKLYYKANGYAEDETIQPYLKHAGFNKHYLKKLASCKFPEAAFVHESSKKQAAETTARLLDSEAKTILEGAFIHQRCYAKVPIIRKQGRSVELCDIQTKVFNPNKQHITNQQGKLLDKWKRYIIDLTYKYWVISKLFPDFEYKMMLWLPDKTKEARCDHLIRNLNLHAEEVSFDDVFCELDVSREVKNMLASSSFHSASGQSFEEVLSDLKSRYFNPEWQEPPVGKKCDRCEFRIPVSQKHRGQESGFEKCWTAVDEVSNYQPGEATVLDLIGPGANHWLNGDVYLLKNVAAKDLPSLEFVEQRDQPITQKQRQSLQVAKAKGQVVPKEIVRPSLFKEIEGWEFPLNFLDFEAGNYAVPIRKNCSPYALVLSQFSCHTLYQDGRFSHHQCLADPSDGYPNYEVIRRLLEVPHIKKGTLVQYSNFEKFALKAVRRELKQELDMVPGGKSLLTGLNDLIEISRSTGGRVPHFADMSLLVKKFYYNRFMNGSLSIKSVLKAAFKVSNFLKREYCRPYSSANFDGMIWWQEADERVRSPYEILRDHQNHQGVGKGAEAITAYGELLAGGLTSQRKQNIVTALQKYCELDTLAMLMIYQHWHALNKA